MLRSLVHIFIFQSLFMFLFLNLLFEPDPYSIEYLLVTIGFDTPENEPVKVWGYGVLGIAQLSPSPRRGSTGPVNTPQVTAMLRKDMPAVREAVGKADVILFSKKGCSFCVHATAILDENKIDYTMFYPEGQDVSDLKTWLFTRPQEEDYGAGRQAKLWRACSRLYRRRFLKVNIHFALFLKIYYYNLLHHFRL